MNKRTKKLLEKVNETFKEFKRPKVVYFNQNKDPNTLTEEELQLQKDFGYININKMSYEKCVMMITDHQLISDEALFYFLPRLVKAVFKEGANEYLLYTRLENIDKTKLKETQLIVLSDLIESLKKLEQNIEYQEELELKQAQEEWIEERTKNGTLNDKLLLAVAKNKRKEVKELISKGADINFQDNYGNTAIKIAQYSNSKKLINLLKKLNSKIQ